jgi:hypothetical protein
MKSNLVNVHTLVNFLKRLGQCYRYSGTLYLVGGSSLLLAAAKQNTFDIDVQFEVPSVHHTEFIRCLRRVSRELKLPVEQASPEQFIPLPITHSSRSKPCTHHASRITHHASRITHHASPITNHQSPITNHQSPIRTSTWLRQP